MKAKSGKKLLVLDQDAIDEAVIAHADDDSAWEKPIDVKRPKRASVTISGELAARAALLARLHREPAAGKWVERVLRERIELEEAVLAGALKKLA